MDASEEHVQTLLSMGFPSESEIRRALKLGKNDLNDAVAILTNEHPGSGFDTLDDVEMKDDQKAESAVYGPSLPPPAYDEVVQTESESSIHVLEETSNEQTENQLFEFPVTNLYELEGRVFTDSWSIPYKKEESLGKCLLAASRLAKEGLLEADEQCRRFLNKCLPECFQKLMFSGAVHRWGSEIHEGIYTMVQLLIDLICARLQHDPVPVDLLDTLAVVFNPDAEFHLKNRASKGDRTYWEEKFGFGKTYAIGPSVNPNGWLTNLINRFAYKDGFVHIERNLKAESLDMDELTALLVPFGVCAEYLNAGRLRPILGPGMDRVVKYVTDMTETDLKDKKVACVSEMLASVKLLCKQLWVDQLEEVDNLRLDIAFRMLKSSNFNARMNALKDVTKLIEDSMASKPVKIAIPSEKLLDWLVDNKILSVALEGNIDQAQYCDKIKGIVDFLGTKLSEEELAKIWHMQVGETNSVIDNIYSIIAVAVVKFNPEQLEQFFFLVQKSWQDENDRIREKLLGLIGRIGKDARNSKITTRVLELLWDLAHLPALGMSLVELALEEHLSILSDSYSVKEQTKRNYVIKCVEDIKKGVWVLPALKQLLYITKNIAKNSYVKAEKGILHELNKGHEIIKLVTNSLVKCHKMSVQATASNCLSPNTMVDCKYRHEEVIANHLTFLQFILQEGVLYLHWHRARDIWDTLVANTDACDWDKQACFDWFTKGISDLEPDTQSSLFQKELLRHDASKITPKVEKTELIGLDYLWEICLNTSDEEIASSAIRLLMSMCYTSLTPKLKRDPLSLHNKFINECYGRLEAALITLEGGGSLIFQALSNATRALTAPCVPEALAVPAPLRSEKLLNIERVLKIAEKYVLLVEELHTTPRTILPHGASFMGNPVNMHCICESPKMDFLIVGHCNESISSVRQKIADYCKTTTDNVQIVACDKLLGPSKDQKLLHQLRFEDYQILSIRILGSSLSTSINQTQEGSWKPDPSTPTKSSFDLEQEKMLPGVVMAMGGQVFGMLYQLSELDEPKITSRVRQLLMLIPTDPAISENLDTLGLKVMRHPSPDGTSPMPSPKASPRKGGFNTSPMPSPRLPPKDILRSYFDANAVDMSTFRVLYNLEVLSSKLMPIILDHATLQSAMAFCEDFLNTGGLGLVVNVLQKDSIPTDVEYVTRQDCYAICLQLARFLLCGETVTGEDHQALLMNRRISTTSITSGTSNGGSASGSTYLTPSPSQPGGSGDKLGPLTIDTSRPSAATRAIQHMGVNDFTETVACLMRVAWAAAAGRLHLASSVQPIRDASVYSTGRRSRQSSTGSSTSTSSESDSQCLHAGVCVQQMAVSSKDTLIAKEALELLVTCLQIRCQLIASFYSLPCVSDFIIDVLVGCNQASIRQEAVDQFTRLMMTEMTPLSESCSHQPTPHQFLVQVLMKARLPFWVSSANTRGSSQRLLTHCSDYFELRCRLLENLTFKQQKLLQVEPMEMLEDEVAWLQNYVSSDHQELQDTDNMLMEGHLNLIRVLLTCQGVHKREIGKVVVKDLLYEFLFPASKMIMDDFEETRRSKGSVADFNPKCSSNQSKTAAYRVLVELADQCLENFEEISTELVSMHHKTDRDSAKEWEYMPPVDSRSSCGFVGLKNGGATCYMNSVLQQLFMTPNIPDYILSVDSNDVEEDSVFYQMQQVFANLTESKLQYYEPEVFWKVFKLWGQTVNIREQQDAFDFFQAVVDQIDEKLKVIGRDQIFKKKFQGIFSDQKICKGCPHRYEREEAFFALNLTVKNATLQESLDQFVKGELLDGDNAYFCEKCGQKRDTIKRMCVKTLPSVLCIQLKRFSYDWEANRALKFDDYFKFPWVLDMEPFTTSGITLQENESSIQHAEDEVFNTSRSSAPTNMNYELVGIIVHSGQANAGHYYSYIKDRRGTTLTNTNKNKWFKFNDTIVEEFDMNDASIESECFGGMYKAKVYEQSSSYPEDRVRYWNGYLLFYERLEDNRSPVLAKKSRISMLKKSTPILSTGLNPERDSLSELTELVHKGEKKHLFTDRMPARIQQTVRNENLSFMKNRDVYDVEYFRFIHALATVNLARTDHERYSDFCLQSLKLSVPFLYNTYYRTKGKLRLDMDDWVTLVSTILSQCKEACQWMIRFMTTDSGRSLIKPYLLECPSKEVRESFCKVLEKIMSSFFHHGGVTTHKLFNDLLEVILQMLHKVVPENCKTSTQYFSVLATYVHMGTKAVTHMFLHNGFPRLVEFLLGTTHTDGQSREASRRWSSVQSREFASLHTTLALLILNCNVSQFRSEEPQNYAIRYPKCTRPQIYLRMSPEMSNNVFGAESSGFIKEVVMAVREIGVSLLEVEDMLVCCSFCNSSFSMSVLKQIMIQYSSAPCNELKGLFSLLTNLLLLKDPLQMKRLQCVIDGYIDEIGTSYEGMLAVIKACHQTDSRRSYQCIKLLVNLSSQCTLVKDYLVQTPTKWQWAVNWLKKKMTDCWVPQANNTSSNEDSNNKSFQRTMSAQDTLAEATAILDELEAQGNAVSQMDTNSSADHQNGDSETGEHNMAHDSTDTKELVNSLDEVDRL